MDDIKALYDAALANPAFQPANGVTHCNEAINSVAVALGCSEFVGLMADEIYSTMVNNASGKWQKVDPSDAAIWALSNGLAIAAMSSSMLGEAHGHVAGCYPVGQQFSGSFNGDVPVLANVGRTVGVMKSSEAFPVAKGMPSFFTYAG
jgi:hypothetical protein